MPKPQPIDDSASEFQGATCILCWRSPSQMGQLAAAKYAYCVKCVAGLVAKEVKRRDTSLVIPGLIFLPLPPRAEWDKLGVKYGHHDGPVHASKDAGRPRKPPSASDYPD